MQRGGLREREIEKNWKRVSEIWRDVKKEKKEKRRGRKKNSEVL